MKDSLDQANRNLKEALEEHKEMQNKVKAAHGEVDYYKKRYDEMFSSVSALNKRIEELEEHKKHLLEKIKSTVRFFGLNCRVIMQVLSIQ